MSSVSTAEEKDARFDYYWRHADQVRERNRAYYYKRRGLPVPEKREYKLRRTEELVSVFRNQAEKLAELEKKLLEKEAELKFREEQLVKIEKSYTLKSYQPSYKPPSAQKKVAACAVGSTLRVAGQATDQSRSVGSAPAPKPEPAPKPAPAPVCFTLGGGNFV